jgi:serine/threonine protein kinase
VVLLTLTTCKFGFENAHKTDKYYKYIMLKYFDEYWDEVSKKIKPISKELKDLFINMVAYKPNERPSIKEILNSEWMKEIRDMNAEQLEQLENEVREEFLKREPLVKEGLSKDMEVEESSSGESSGNRGAEDNEEFFDLNLKPKYAQTGLNMNNYIKLTGNLNPSVFMNSLANKIIKEYKSENCKICPIQDKLKFNVIFNNEKSGVDDDIPENMKEEFKKLGIEENDNIDENENILGLKTVIQIKMYESYNGGYLLRFVKKDGDLCDYLNRIEKIYSLIKENKN